MSRGEPVGSRRDVLRVPIRPPLPVETGRQRRSVLGVQSRFCGRAAGLCGVGGGVPLLLTTWEHLRESLASATRPPTRSFAGVGSPVL